MKSQMSPCPDCGKEPDAEHLPPEEVDPGGMYPCWSCGAVRIFSEDGTLREPGEEERQLIDANPQVFFMRRFAGLRRGFAAWCAANQVSEPGPDDALRFFLAGGMMSPEPVTRPDWTQHPSVLIASEVSLAGVHGPSGNQLVILRRPDEPEGPGSAELVFTSEEWDELVRQVTIAERMAIAAYFDGLLLMYPEDIFMPGGLSRDSVAAAAMRHAYSHAAETVRDGRYRG